MKPAVASVPITGHPADRILAIVDNLQKELRDREASARLHAREELKAEFQSKLDEAQAAIAQLQHKLEETIRSKAEFQSQLDEAHASVARLYEQAGIDASRWQEERARLQEQIAVLTQDVETGKTSIREDADNRNVLQRTLAETIQSKEELALQLQRVASELQSKNKQDDGPSAHVAAIVGPEIARVQSVIDEINSKLNDSSVELSAEMRLKRERTEQEAYLNGLRYSLAKMGS
jgi:chromosome segregation ATPase